MRAFLATLGLLLLTLAASPASAAKCPPVCVGAGYEATLPSDGCGDCVGVEAHAGTIPQSGCADCDAVGGGVGAEHDGDGTTASAKVCKSGFVYVCLVDEEITV
jgi:hypothetical protein